MLRLNERAVLVYRACYLAHKEYSNLSILQSNPNVIIKVLSDYGKIIELLLVLTVNIVTSHYWF